MNSLPKFRVHLFCVERRIFWTSTSLPRVCPPTLLLIPKIYLRIAVSDEYVVFIRPTKLQLQMFETILTPDYLDELISAGSMSTLALISRLMKLCNTPVLLMPKKDKPESLESAAQHAINRALKLLPRDAIDRSVELSGT